MLETIGSTYNRPDFKSHLPKRKARRDDEQVTQEILSKGQYYFEKYADHDQQQTIEFDSSAPDFNVEVTIVIILFLCLQFICETLNIYFCDF